MLYQLQVPAWAHTRIPVVPGIGFSALLGACPVQITCHNHGISLDDRFFFFHEVRVLSRVLPHWPVYSEKVELVFITGFQAVAYYWVRSQKILSQVFLYWFVDSKPVNLALKPLRSASQAFLLPAALLTPAPTSRYQPHYPT